MTSLERVLDDYTASSLLATIREKPTEDVPRLMFADRIQELGGKELELWAEFIRLQIELSNWPCSAFMYSCHENGFDECQCGDAKRVALARRVSHITPFVNSILHEITGDLQPLFTSRRGFPAVVSGNFKELHYEPCRGCHGNGKLFYDCVHCDGYGRVHDPDSKYEDGTKDCEHCKSIMTCQECDGTGGFKGILPDIVDVWPIESVHVQDRYPLVTNGSCYWSSGYGLQPGGNVLTTPLVLAMQPTWVFDTAKQARHALSGEMLRFARRTAKKRKVGR